MKITLKIEILTFHKSHGSCIFKQRLGFAILRSHNDFACSVFSSRTNTVTQLICVKTSPIDRVIGWRRDHGRARGQAFIPDTLANGTAWLVWWRLKWTICPSRWARGWGHRKPARLKNNPHSPFASARRLSSTPSRTAVREPARVDLSHLTASVCRLWN